MHPDPFHYVEYKVYILTLTIGRTLSGTTLIPHSIS